MIGKIRYIEIVNNYSLPLITHRQKLCKKSLLALTSWLPEFANH